MSKRHKAPTLEDCKRALRVPRRRILGAPPHKKPDKVPAYLLAWAIREIERLRDPEWAEPPEELKK